MAGQDSSLSSSNGSPDSRRSKLRKVPRNDRPDWFCKSTTFDLVAIRVCATAERRPREQRLRGRGLKDGSPRAKAPLDLQWGQGPDLLDLLLRNVAGGMLRCVRPPQTNGPPPSVEVVGLGCR